MNITLKRIVARLEHVTSAPKALTLETLKNPPKTFKVRLLRTLKGYEGEYYKVVQVKPGEYVRGTGGLFNRRGGKIRLDKPDLSDLAKVYFPLQIGKRQGSYDDLWVSAKDLLENAELAGGSSEKKALSYDLRSIPKDIGITKYSNAELIEIALEVGEKMFGNSHTGLQVAKKPRIFKTNNFKRLKEDVENTGDEAEALVGTYEYIFFPSKRKGLDGSDELNCIKDAKRMMDVDGNIYLCDGETDTISVMKPVVPSKDFEAVRDTLAASLE